MVGNGGVPKCKQVPFRKPPAIKGDYLDEAAITGERICPKCMNLSGELKQIVDALFEDHQKPEDTARA